MVLDRHFVLNTTVKFCTHDLLYVTCPTRSDLYSHEMNHLLWRPLQVAFYSSRRVPRVGLLHLT